MGGKDCICIEYLMLLVFICNLRIQTSVFVMLKNICLCSKSQNVILKRTTVYKQQNGRCINGDKINTIITALTEMIKLCKATFAPLEKC